MFSGPVLIAMNSEPNTKFSILLVYFFKNQEMGTSFKNMKNPILDLLFAPSPA